MPMAHPPVPPPKPQRGRPRDPERGRRILEAAQRHFNEHGLERASVDAIASFRALGGGWDARSADNIFVSGIR